VNPTAKALWMGLERSDAFINTFSTGLEGDDWFQRPDGLPNPAIWILGHLAHTRAKFLKMLIGEELHDESWDELFDMGVEPRDPKEYPGVEICHEALDKQFAQLKSYLETATEADLQGPPAVPSEYFDSKAAVIAFLTVHEAHHTGALSMTRRLLGKDRLF
jgi:uncharacterized damage-inducible protein DinB